jgi:hypothetical protein
VNPWKERPEKTRGVMIRIHATAAGRWMQGWFPCAAE